MALLLQSGLGLDPLTEGLVFALTSLAAPRRVQRFGNEVIGFGMLLYALVEGQGGRSRPGSCFLPCTCLARGRRWR